MARFIEVVNLETGKVIHRVDVSGRSDRSVEQVERGMLINMDRERFCTQDTGETPCE